MQRTLRSQTTPCYQIRVASLTGSECVCRRGMRTRETLPLFLIRRCSSCPPTHCLKSSALTSS
uniref:Uncharacterized protein n=1 Tax=Anguilla anguilla TaxID=7936 RepID=A0A0E9SQH3_ANGAN